MKTCVRFVIGLVALSAGAMAAPTPSGSGEAERAALAQKLEDKSLPLAERIKAGQALMEKQDAARAELRRQYDEADAKLVVYRELGQQAQRRVELGVLTLGAVLVKEMFDGMNLPGTVGEFALGKLQDEVLGELGAGPSDVGEKTVNAAAVRDKCDAWTNEWLDVRRPKIFAGIKTLIDAKAGTANRVKVLQAMYDDAVNRPRDPAPKLPAPKPQSKVKPVPAPTAEPDWPKLNKTWEMIRNEAWPERPQDRDGRHGFRYHATARGKPSLSGWCKPAKEGSYVNAQGKTVRYWLWYYAHVTISEPWDNRPPGPNGLWPQMERGRQDVQQGDRAIAWQQAYVGDFGLSGYLKDSRGLRTGARCHGWLGPVHIQASVDVRGDAEGGEVDAGARAAAGERSLAEAELLGKNISWVLETWFERPVASGPGLKGLHFPLSAASYLPGAGDFPAEAMVAPDGSGPSAEPRQDIEAAYTARWKTRLDRYRVAIRGFGLERGQTSEAQPLERAQQELRERMARVLADFKSQAGSDSERNLLSGPMPLAIEGAEEAWEIVWRDDCVNENRQWVFVRRANVIAVVEVRYVPGPPGERDFAGAPLGERFAAVVLAKLRAEPALNLGKRR